MPKPPKSGIYQILNTINGHRYIGSAVNMWLRKNSHWSELRRGVHRNGHLQHAWNLYGRGIFVFSVLEYVADRERLLEREQYYLDALDPEYNILKRAGSMLGYKASPLTRARVSAAMKRRVMTEEHRQHLSEAGTGKVFSPTARRNMSTAARGRWDDPEYRAKLVGENGSKAKLTEADVLEILDLLRESVLTQGEIGARYGVSESAVWHIKKGTTWKHVPRSDTGRCVESASA